MTTFYAAIGPEGRRKLYLTASRKEREHKHRGIHGALAQLGEVIVLHRADGTKASALVGVHWPADDWRTIANAFRSGEYIRTGSGELVFTE